MNVHSGLAIQLIETPDELKNRCIEWDACVQDYDADIFFSVDWILTWWAHFGDGRKFLACFLRDSRGIVGALPLSLDAFRVGPFTFRIARLAGTDYNYPIMKLPLRAERAEECLMVVLRHLTTAQQCAGIALSPISATAGLDGTIFRAASRAELSMVRSRSMRQHTIMRLPNSVADYWSSLSSSRRRDVRRSKKLMEKRFSLIHRVSNADDAGIRFDEFARQHTEQWRDVDKGGHFGDWPGSQAFYRDVVCRLAPSGRARIEQHLGDGVVLSSQLTFLSGSRAYWRLTARTVDPDATRMGVAKVGMVERVEELIGSGAELVEAAAGEYDYKLSYGGERASVQEFVVGEPRQNFHVKLLLAWADLLNLLYYRLWFLKTAPRLRRTFGFKPKALWQVWIRTRL